MRELVGGWVGGRRSAAVVVMMEGGRYECDTEVMKWSAYLTQVVR